MAYQFVSSTNACMREAGCWAKSLHAREHSKRTHYGLLRFWPANMVQNKLAKLISTRRKSREKLRIIRPHRRYLNGIESKKHTSPTGMVRKIYVLHRSPWKMSMMPTTMKRKRATLCLPHMSNISRRQFARPPHHLQVTKITLWWSDH